MGDEACKKCDEMKESVKCYKRHVILCSSGDYEFDICETGIMHQLKAAIDEKLIAVASSAEAPPSTIKLSQCDIPKSIGDMHSETSTVIVYPESVFVTLTIGDVLPFADWLLDSSTKLDSINLAHEPLPWKRLALVCTHMGRDKRCGRAGPQVVESLRKELANRDITTADICVCGSSHIGGHKYAGTLIVYPEAQWYGRVTKSTTKQLLDHIIDGTGATFEKCYRGRGYEW